MRIKPPTILSGSSNPLLAQRVCEHLELRQGQVLVGSFSDGEVRVEIQENVRGRNVYVMQSTCPPVNDNLIELLVMIDALKRASAGRVNAVIPYYGYGRQDQKNKPRVPITARMVADLLTVAGADRVIAIDLHVNQIQGFFKIPVDHLYGIEVLLADVKSKLAGNEIVVAPDAGGVERARLFAKRLNVGLAIMDHRSAEGLPFSRIVGRVKGRPVIILDDMVDTGRTLIRATEAAVAAGAVSVDAYCVHAVLSGSAVTDLQRSSLRTLTVTDTIPLTPEAAGTEKIHTVTTSPMLAEVIRRVHYEESVSSLFA